MQLLIFPISLLASGLIIMAVPYYYSNKLVYIAVTLASSASISFSLQFLLELSPLFRPYLHFISYFNIMVGHNCMNALGFLIPLSVSLYLATKAEVDKVDIVLLITLLGISSTALTLYKLGLIPYIPELLVYRNYVGYSPDIFLVMAFSYSLFRKKNPCKLAYVEMFIAGAYGDMVAFVIGGSHIIAGGLGFLDGDFLLPLLFSLELRLLKRFKKR
ncbi:hypothetical protein [Stygiolobus caldivivus]|uniref:Uncharacterized protein n=1 Tax=Stygiolobus caldivivus TaxID=2824673 RepID=A0A8D5U451_9CREN|nr:hypothetical protein [Stygiolobus caldivivus]BCU68907.1 hypothetical protein KN1_02040 [Stygiolobus caldivivus]